MKDSQPQRKYPALPSPVRHHNEPVILQVMSNHIHGIPVIEPVGAGPCARPNDHAIANDDKFWELRAKGYVRHEDRKR